MDTQRSFTTERDFGALHPEDARISARRTERGTDRPTRQEAQFHQPIGKITGKIQIDQRRGFSTAKFRESTGLAPARLLVETQLHLFLVSYRGKRLSTSTGPRHRVRARIAEVIEPSPAREYTREEVCRLLRISRTVLATWERQGFVPPAEHFGFRDLVALKSLAQLRRNRVRPERIRRIVENASRPAGQCPRPTRGTEDFLRRPARLRPGGRAEDGAAQRPAIARLRP